MKKLLLSLLIGGTTLGAGVIADSRIDPYTDKGASLEIAEISTLPDAGEVKTILSKDEPKVTLEKWNGEVALGVRYVGLPQNTSGSRALLTNRMEWKGAKEEMHAYPLEKGEGMEDGGFIYELVLIEKPDTNRFCFLYDGVENLEFFKQLPLWQEQGLEAPIATCTDTDCDSDGDGEFDIHRPENVVNSYAIYHSTKANHRRGQTNYATGKFAHRYRPQATDANGIQTWGDTEYSNGEMCDIIPQDWLNNAAYPVKL